MDKKIAAYCEACGGLLPLKPIPKRRRNKQRQGPSLQEEPSPPSPPEDVRTSKDSHLLQPEPGANESAGDSLETSLPSSSNSDGETEESSGKKRSYASMLEEIQAIFAGQKVVKRETITAYMHRCQRQREQKSDERRSQAGDDLPAIPQHASTSKSRRPDVNLSPLNPPYHRKCKPSFVDQLPSGDASTCSFDPLRISPSPLRTSQSCTHHLGEHSTREQIGEATRRPGAGDNHQEVEFAAEPRVDNDCYHDVQRLYEECHIHEIDEHITATLIASPRKSPLHRYEERGFQTQPPQIIYSCHQQTVVRHREAGCHLHQRDDLELPRSPSPGPRDSRKCQRCGCTQQEVCPATQEGSLQGPADYHHRPKAYGRSSCEQEVTACAQRLSSCNIMHGEDGCQEKMDEKPDHSHEERACQTQPQQIVYSCHQTVVRHHESCHLHHRDDLDLPRSQSPRRSRKCQRCGCTQQEVRPATQEGSLHGRADYHHRPKAHGRTSCEQEVTACTQRLYSCSTHGRERMDVCGGDVQRKASEDRPCPTNEKKIQCGLHSDPCPPKCQEPKDPLVWTPRRVWKPKPCSVHWLDRVTASQNIPPHIVRQFVQGKRRCPLRGRTQKCAACAGKARGGNADPCRREVPIPAWNPGSDIAERAVEWKERRGKLSRLALSRVLIVKPVPKVSTSQGLWTRKEFEVCSECRDLNVFRSVGMKSGRWSSILETMSSHEECDVTMSSNCSTRFSCHTVHGLSIPGSARGVDLRGPELHSAFRLRTKLQKLQKETFDRRAAIQVARMEGLELDKEVFDLVPEKSVSQKGRSSRTRSVCRRRRWEVYRGLSKIVGLPMAPCQQCLPKDVGVQVFGQVYKREAGPDGKIWNPDDFFPKAQSSNANPTVCVNCPVREESRCVTPEQSLDEQRWAYLVEKCRETRMAKGSDGTSAQI